VTVITSLAGMPMVQTGSASTPPRLGHTASPSDLYGFAPAQWGHWLTDSLCSSTPPRYALDVGWSPVRRAKRKTPECSSGAWPVGMGSAPTSYATSLHYACPTSTVWGMY